MDTEIGIILRNDREKRGRSLLSLLENCVIFFALLLELFLVAKVADVVGRDVVDLV